MVRKLKEGNAVEKRVDGFVLFSFCLRETHSKQGLLPTSGP